MKAKAPEKLYVTNDEKRFGDKCHSASTEKYVDDDVEYIRKDAIIALLDAEKEETAIGLNEWENGVEHGRMDAISSLKEKIKAL